MNGRHSRPYLLATSCQWHPAFIANESKWSAQRTLLGYTYGRMAMQTEPETWKIVLFLVLLAAIVLPLGGLLVIAFVDLIRAFRRRLPSRFQRVSQYNAFDQNELQAAAKTLGFKLGEEVPHEIHEAVRLALGADFIELADGLSRRVKGGMLLLCNVRHQSHSTQSHQDGSAPTRRTHIVKYTALIFFAETDGAFPPFNLRPNPKSLMLDLFNSRIYCRRQFEADPEFNEKVLACTFEPNALGALLTPPVRVVLKANSDLTTAVMDRVIVVYDRGNSGRRFRWDGHIDCEVLDPHDWPKFYRAAGSVIKALRRAGWHAHGFA